MQIGGGAGEGDATVAEDVDAVGDLKHLADLLLDDQDGDAVVAVSWWCAARQGSYYPPGDGGVPGLRWKGTFGPGAW